MVRRLVCLSSRGTPRLARAPASRLSFTMDWAGSSSSSAGAARHLEEGREGRADRRPAAPGARPGGGARSRSTSRARFRRGGSAWAGGRSQPREGAPGPPSGEPLDAADVDGALAAVAAETRARARPSAGSAAARRCSSAPRAGPALLVELLIGEVRQGALEGLVQRGDREGRGPARRATSAGRDVRADLGELARAALEEGAAGLVALLAAAPLARRADAGEHRRATRRRRSERLGEAAFEYKLDGARIQVHKAGDEVRVFTRAAAGRDRSRARGRGVGARAAGARERSSRARRSRCGPTGGRGRSRPRCAGSAAARTSSRARRRCRFAFFFDLLHLEGEGTLDRAALRGARRAAAAARRPGARSCRAS